MATQLARRTVERFASDDWRDAETDEAARAFKDHFGSFGIDVQAPAVIHHVEGAWFPNLYGADRFRLDGDRLHLDADTAWGEAVIIWKRAQPYPATG